SRRRHTRSKRDWSSDVCSSDLVCACPITSLPSRTIGIVCSWIGVASSYPLRLIAFNRLSDKPNSLNFKNFPPKNDQSIYDISISNRLANILTILLLMPSRLLLGESHGLPSIG